MVKASRAEAILGSAIMAPLTAVFQMLKAGAEVSAPKRKCNGGEFGFGGGLFHLHDFPKLRISASLRALLTK
jgi:hypothetical protein